MTDSASALEQFRQEWREEVTAKGRKSEKSIAQPSGPSRTRRESASKPDWGSTKPPTRHPVADLKDDSDVDSGVESSSVKLGEKLDRAHLDDADQDEFGMRPGKAPETALEHFEHAIEREGQGNLGDSVRHYRKAYKLDDKVDQVYKQKHFAHRWKPADSNPSNASATVPNPAHHSSQVADEPLSTLELVESFVGIPIEGIPPVIERDIPPPCPIQRLPAELLVEMLQIIGTKDPALLARIAPVCKNLAYHVFTENSIWKRIALGPNFGFASQQYKFTTDVQGRELIYTTLHPESNPDTHITENDFPRDTIWRDVFHQHPRIRYSGLYISTVNYSRPGGASATQHVWSNPVHIVTYYRYLRFYRNGTCISLLTTNEPNEVVPYLTAENLDFVRSKGNAKTPAHIPAAGAAVGIPPSAQVIMKHALRGRWRIVSPTASKPDLEQERYNIDSSLVPGDVCIETEGAGPRYVYTMHLSLKSTSPKSKTASKNTKLIWKGFWSYNQLSNDWAEFGLRNDKPFYFSRVKRYGLGY